MEPLNWHLKDPKLKNWDAKKLGKVLTDLCPEVQPLSLKKVPQKPFALLKFQTKEDHQLFFQRVSPRYALTLEAPWQKGALKRKFRQTRQISSILDVVVPWHEKPYTDQLNAKESEARELLDIVRGKTKQNRLAAPPELEFLPIIPAEEGRQAYRNKCEFTFGQTFGDPKKPALGFVRDKTPEFEPLVELPGECPHLSRGMLECAQFLNRELPTWQTQFNLQIYERKGQTGDLRLCSLREHDSQLMLTIQVSKLTETSEGWLKTLSQYEGQLLGDSRLTTCYVDSYAGVCDVFGGADTQRTRIFGPEGLNLTLGGLRFEALPDVFLQPNLIQAEELYRKVYEFLDPKDELILDLCSGVGTIGLTLAHKFPETHVVCVEINQQSVDQGKKAMATNGLTQNVEFFSSPAENFWQTYAIPKNKRSKFFKAVVDPPRGGLHSKLIKTLRNTEDLERLVYVSCNPGSLKTDLLQLCAFNPSGPPSFVATRAVVVDMLPFTPHSEVVVLLERL